MYEQPWMCMTRQKRALVNESFLKIPKKAARHKDSHCQCNGRKDLVLNGALFTGIKR